MTYFKQNNRFSIQKSLNWNTPKSTCYISQQNRFVAQLSFDLNLFKIYIKQKVVKQNPIKTLKAFPIFYFVFLWIKNIYFYHRTEQSKQDIRLISDTSNSKNNGYKSIKYYIRLCFMQFSQFIGYMQINQL